MRVVPFSPWLWVPLSSQGDHVPLERGLSSLRGRIGLSHPTVNAPHRRYPLPPQGGFRLPSSPPVARPQSKQRRCCCDFAGGLGNPAPAVITPVLMMFSSFLSRFRSGRCLSVLKVDGVHGCCQGRLARDNAAGRTPSRIGFQGRPVPGVVKNLGGGPACQCRGGRPSSAFGVRLKSSRCA